MKHPIRRRLMYLGFQGLCALVQHLPLALSRAVGRALGTLAYLLLVSQRRLVVAHLRLAFGNTLSNAERGRIARGVFVNLGQTAVEWMALPTLSNETLQRLIASEGVEHLRQALSQGNGVILITAHFGNWELISLYLKSLGFEGGALARRLRYPEYESFLISMRGARGIPTFARGSLKEVAKVLRANQIIGILPDQDIDSLEGVFVRFFEQPTYTPVGPAALALMTGAPIVPCFILRTGRTFRLMVEPPIPIPETNDRTQALTQLTQAWSDVVESYIRRQPDHWVWMHRRWKTQPTAATHETQHVTSQPERDQSNPTPIQATKLVLALWLVTCHAVLVTMCGGCGKSASKSTSTPPPSATANTTESASSEANQQMSGFTLTGYHVDGAKRWQLDGEGAIVDGNIVTIRRPNAVGYNPTQTAYLTASLAAVNQTNQHVRMEHDVTIHTSEGLWLTSPVLHWLPDQDEVATDQSVRIETDHMLLRGRGATGLTQLKHATLLQDIELVLNPSEHDVGTAAPRQVTITCDGPLAFDYANNVATFEHNVHVQDPNGDLYSDKLIAYLDQKTHTIRYAEAIGKVRIHQQQNTALSERAVYEPAIGKITLVGKPSLLVYPSKGGGNTQLSFGGLVASPAPAPVVAPAHHDGDAQTP